MDRELAIKVVEGYTVFIVGDIITGKATRISSAQICSHVAMVDLMRALDVEVNDLFVGEDSELQIPCRHFVQGMVDIYDILVTQIQRMNGCQ